MKIYEIADERKELGAVLSDIFENTSQGLIKNTVTNTDVAIIAVEDPDGSGVKEILSARYYEFGKEASHRRFQSSGFYFNKTLYNVSSYELFTHYELYRASEEELSDIFKDYFQVARVRPSEIPNQIMSYMWANYPTLEDLEKAGYKKEVKEAKEHQYDTAVVQSRIIQNADLNYNVFKNVEFTDIVTLIQVDAGNIPESQFIKDLLQCNTSEKFNPYLKWANYLEYLQTVKEVEASLPKYQQEVQKIREFADNNGIDEKANITVKIKGKDSLLDKSLEYNYPDFSIEGKTVSIKLSLGGFFNRMRPDKDDILIEVYYREQLSPVLKEKYSNRNKRYLDKYYFSDIQSITNGRKTLYSR